MAIETRGMAKMDPDNIRKVIYTIDAYRNHVFYDISWIDKMVKEKTLGPKFAAIWKPLRTKMIKMASVTRRIDGLTQLVRLQTYAEALWQISIPILFILLFVGILMPTLPLIATIAPFVMIFAFGAVLVGVLAQNLIGGKIAHRINNYFAEHPDVDELRDPELRKAVQLLLEELRNYLRRKGEDPEDHLVGVECQDYKNIEIVKEPKPWRKYYLVKVII